MTDPVPASPTPDEPPPERVRVTAQAAARRTAVAPAVYAAGAAVLALALFFLWRYPAGSRRAAEESNRLAAVEGQVSGLADRIGRLENRPAPSMPDLAPLEARLARLEARPTPPANPPSMDLGPLEARVAKLEARPTPDLQPLEARIARLEARPPAPPPVDLSGITARLDALARDEAAAGAKRDGELAALGGRVDGATGELGNRSSAVDAHVAAVERAEKDVSGVAARAQRTAAVQAASAALDAGKPLGPVPDAPPALARFALSPPPTVAQLRLAYGAAADAAHRASQPAITTDQNFLQRAWTTAQQAVTVRRGDDVLVGDPVAGVLAHAQELLDAGDLPGCLRVLKGLAGPAAAAMADWTAQAQALLDARAALAAMAAG